MEPLLNNIIKAFGWSIFHSLWQGAIVYGILFIVVMFIPRLTAQTKHNLAFGSICLTFVSFCITFCTIFDVPRAGLSTATLPAEILFSNYLPSLSERISNQAEQFFPMLVALYSLGLVLQMGLLVHSYSRINALRKSAKDMVPAAWLEIFNTTRTQLKIRRKVSFYLSDQVNVPIVLGFLKPIVLFPIALANNLDLNQVEAILFHELSHIRRNDYLLNLVKTAIETILFFNPFIWLSGRFIHIEREHACDDLVVAFTGTPVTYAHALLKLELLQAKNSPAMAMAATGKHQYLYQRIKRITNMKANYMNVRQQILLITVTFSTIISLAWINPDQSKATVKRIVANVAHKIDVFDSKQSSDNLKDKFSAGTEAKPADTTKKKARMKIITEDAKGKQTTYNSIEELPDSLKRELHVKGIYMDGKRLSSILVNGRGDSSIMGRGVYFNPKLKVLGREYKGNRDSAYLSGFSLESSKLMKELQRPEVQLKVRAMGIEMGKTAEAFAKKFNTPEEKAKWVKLQADLRKNSDAFIKQFNTPEQKARLAELFNNLPSLGSGSIYATVDGLPVTMSSLKSITVDSSKRILKVNGKNYQDEINLMNTPEYKELRKKFQEEVEALRKKKALDKSKN